MKRLGRKISVNIRFLLWQRGIARDHWANWLEVRSSVRKGTIDALLRGQLTDAHIDEDLVSSLATPFAVDPADLRFEDLVSLPESLLQENLRHLLNNMEHGGKKSLAKDLQIDPTTISRWLNGSYIPKGSTLGRLVAYFGLPVDTDLQTDPVFLTVEPTSVSDKRRWLQRRVNDLDVENLRELFPALRRLLEQQ